MESHLDPQIQALTDRLLGMAEGGRRLIAIVGAPGSGKSTLSHQLCDVLNAARPGVAAVVPMDGFHYDDAVLRSKGVLTRKGAPFTFDVGGLISLLGRLRRNDEDEIAIPAFDRALEISRAAADIVPRAVPLLLVEGNYLLLDQAPWASVAPFFDLTVMLDVPEAELERRLTARWVDHGYSADGIRAKLQENDLPNARTVIAQSRPADVTIRQG